MRWLIAMAGRLAVPLRPGAFRLFLAMLVIVHHFSSFALGAFAVYVFFVLSGFWVQRMWSERYAATRQPYLTYIVSRVWRLAPVMALVSAITIPTLLVVGLPAHEVLAADPLALLASSTLLLGYSWLAYPPVGSAWSLDVEMQFYVVAPALAWLIPRGGATSVLVAALAASLVGSQVFETPVLPKYLLFFVAGMAAARLDWRPGRQAAVLSAAAVIVVVVAVFVSPWRDVLIGGATPGPLHRYNLPYNVGLALAAIPFAIHTTGIKGDADDA